MLRVFVAILFGWGAWAGSFSTIDSMSEGWLQDAYELSLEDKEIDAAMGICAAAHGTYSYQADSLSQESMLNLMMALARFTLSDVVDTHTQVGAQTAKFVRPFDTEAARAIDRALGDNVVYDELALNKEEFGQGKIMLGADILYGRKVGNEPRVLTLISYYGILDLDNQEIYIVGNGDCTY